MTGYSMAGNPAYPSDIMYILIYRANNRVVALHQLMTSTMETRYQKVRKRSESVHEVAAAVLSIAKLQSIEIIKTFNRQLKRLNHHCHPVLN